MIALVGFMGAGKTTVGRLLASQAGLPFVDVDQEVEAAAGKTVGAIFDEDGEAAFRRLESRTIHALLEGPEVVLALGGGALGDPTVATALQWAKVVFLDVSFGEAMRRVRGTGDRPMLRRFDPKALYEQRRAVYERAAHHVVPVDGRSPEEVAGEVARVLGIVPDTRERRVRVPLDRRAYDVIVGAGLVARLGELVTWPPDAEKAFVVTHPELEGAARGVTEALSSGGLAPHVLTVPSGEATKSLDEAARLLAGLASAGAHRHDLVVGFGGGVVTDLAGFVASVYHRGMPVVHVATSLLAQVDAAVGGKTGVNLPQGKNLVGTFHQPRAVVCDVSLLQTLPDPELVAGLAEVVKYGLISDPTILTLVSENAADLRAKEPALLADVVTRSVAIKARVVAADETESGARAHLNYGHTFGHAIEHVTARRGAPLRHGEAVALGMMAAAYAAHELGRIDDHAVAAHRRSLEAVGLPVSAAFDLDDLETAWQHDKKYRRGVRFVLLAGLGRPEAGVEVDRGTLEKALRRLSG